MSRHMQLIAVGVVCFLLGWLATPRLPFVHAQETPKEPKCLQGLDLKVRKAGVAAFTKDTQTFGVEIFKDETNNNLIYITENGAIAVVPAK